MSVAKSSPCFICSDFGSVRASGGNGNGVLSRQLEVIFVLCKVLEVPQDKVACYLQEFPAVEQWIRVCEQCGEVVKRCWGIWVELKETQRRFQECQHELIGMIREKGGVHQEDAVVGKGGRIFRECRQFVNEYEYSIPTNPFIEGDLIAQEKAVSGVMKTEPEEEEGDPDCEWTPGENDNPSSDDEISDCSSSDKEDKVKSVVKPASKTVWKPKPGGLKRCLVLNCSRKFGDWDKLTRHLTSEHSAEERQRGWKLECSECPVLFTSYKSLQCHATRVHRLTKGARKVPLSTRYVLESKPGLGTCPKLKKSEQEGGDSNQVCSESEEEDSGKATTTGRIYRFKPCLVRLCSRKFRGWQTLSKHLTSEHSAEERQNGWKLACLQCPVLFTSYKSLQSHTVKVHGAQNSQDGLRTRYVMEETKEKRERKEKTRTYKGTFKCPFCGHFRYHSTELSKMCRHLEVCRKQSNLANDLNCPTCKVFSCSGASPAEFANHWISCGVTVTGTNIQVSLADRIFHCKLCSEDASWTGKVFFKLTRFLDHYFLHQQLRFKCTECGEKLKNMNHSRYHWQKKHANLLLTRGTFVPTQCYRQLEPHPLPEVYWWCTECGAQFLSENERDEHVKQGHPDNIKVEKMERCSFCIKQYTCPKELKLHQITTHILEMGKLIPCQLCEDPQLFLNTEQILVHRRLFHKHEVLKCRQCGREFLDTDQLFEHTVNCTQNDSEQSREQKCKICDKLFASRETLRHHVRLIHIRKEQATCHACGRRFVHRRTLQVHLFKVHQIENPSLRQCSEPGCEKTFSLFQDLREHVIKCHGGQRQYLKCSYCGKDFSGATSLKRHELIMHKLKGDNSKWFSCDLCPFKSPRNDNLIVHQKKMHNPEKPKCLSPSWPCHHCGAILKTKKKLLEHVRSVHKPISKIAKVRKTAKPPMEKPLKPCPVPNCLEKFPSSQALMDHLKTGHSKEERIEAIRVPCSECGKMLAGPNSLHCHQAEMHKLKENSVCDVCGKIYSTRHTLAQHKRRTLQCRRLQMSEAEATEICDICGKRYSNKYKLAKHVREQHEGRFREKCELCGKGLEDKHKLAVHLAVAHGIKGENLKEYRCSEPGCGKVFYRKLKLDWHVLGVHKKGEPQFGCKHCAKRFYTPGALQQHVNWVHKGYRWHKQKKTVKTA